MTIVFSYYLREMLRVTFVVSVLLHIILALENQTELIIDLYHKINKSGSLLKATSFDDNMQSKLKEINIKDSLKINLKI